MAGDWIKVEHATIDKPEVARAAEMLGIKRDEMLGLLCRYWIWLDRNLSGSCPGFVRNVSAKGLDESMHCPGFSATLAAIGWAEFDADAWTLRVTNHDRHNGNTAKSRALDNKRKSDSRREMSGSEPDKSRTREEKRREEINTKSRAEALANARPSTLSTGTRLDPLWALPIDWLKWALQERPDWNSVEAERVALMFRDFWHAKAGPDARKVDWFACWRNWVKKERRSYVTPKEPTLAARRARNIDILTGKVSNERTIEGVAERVDKPTVLTFPGDIREPGGDDVGRLGYGRSALGVG